MLSSFNCFCLFLTALTPAVDTSAPVVPQCPPPSLLTEKLDNLTATLNNINNSLDCVFDIIDEQCPCLDPICECFEEKVSDFRTALEGLIGHVDNATDSVPTDCPDRTAAVFVATCNGTDVAVVDPNGIIQNGFNTGTNVFGWAVYINYDTYGIDYFTNNPFEVWCWPKPNLPEVLLGNASTGPNNPSATGTGIFFDPATENDYVAISFDDVNLNGIYCFNRTDPPQITLLFSYNGTTGNIELHDGYVYMSDGQWMLRRPLVPPPDDWEHVFFHPVDIKDFNVAADWTIVFSDTSGFVWKYDPAPVPPTFQQLKTPTNNVIQCSVSIQMSPCDSLVYVAYIDDANLEVYNATSFELVDSLTYTESTPSPCPTIGFDPTICCA